MSINRALPSIRADVAAIYAAPDHASLVAIYTRLCGDFNPQDYADCERDGIPGADLREVDDMRQHLLDYMLEMCYSCGVSRHEAGIRFDDDPVLSVRDLTATNPDDYPEQEFDVIATYADGTVRYSDGTFSNESAAEEFIAANPGDLDQWCVVRGPEPAIPVGEVTERPGVHEAMLLACELETYLREIRAENLDGSEPALGELLDRAQALREAFNA